MPLVVNAKDAKRLQNSIARKLGKPILAPKKSEMELRRGLNDLWVKVLLPATERIKDMIRDGAPLSRIAQLIEDTLVLADMQYRAVASGIVDKWKASVDEKTRAEMNRSIRIASGIDLTYLLDSAPVKEALAAGVFEATQLIKTIPSQYLGRVAKAVTDNFAGRQLSEGRSLLQEIMHVGGVSKRRAKLIARDQTSKLTGTLNQVRQQSIGIEEYVWRTSQDERVVGDPAGLYPKGSRAHRDHFHRNGKRFRWDDPPDDGHPGQAIQCRCHAQPVIDIQKILAKAEKE